MKADSLKRAKPLELPESVAWMERLSMSMATTANEKLSFVKRNNTLYELQLSFCYGKDKDKQFTSWTVSHTFSEYRALQRRLVKAIKPGHKCNAECKWLVNVIKNYFPKATMFCENCPSTVESRRLSLLRLMMTIKTSLVNHGNAGCAILRDHVSKEFAAFLVSDCKDEALHYLKHTTSVSVTSTQSTFSSTDEATECSVMSSMVSFASDDENLVPNFGLDGDTAALECGLYGLSLDMVEEASCTSFCCTTATFKCSHQVRDVSVLPRPGEDR